MIFSGSGFLPPPPLPARRGCAPFLALAGMAGCLGGGQPQRSRSGAPSRRLRVLVDMDGVLADFEGGFLKKFRAKYPGQPYIALEDRRGFWVSEQYGQLAPELSEKAISIWESKYFFLELDPLPGAVEAVKQMAKLEATDVFICTSPIKKYHYCPYEKEDTIPWSTVSKAAEMSRRTNEDVLPVSLPQQVIKQGDQCRFPTVTQPEA